MSNRGAVAAALRNWLRDAQANKGLRSGSVIHHHQMYLVQNADQITEEDVIRQVPALESYAAEVVRVLQDAARPAGAPTDDEEGRPTPASAVAGDVDGGLSSASQAPVAAMPAAVFAPYTGGLVGAAEQNVSVTVGEGESRHYSWGEPSAKSGVAVYRVVTSDVASPLSPEDGEILAITLERTAVDLRPSISATRYVQVWVNQGPDYDAAAQAQPTLLASAETVAPVRQVTATSDHGAFVARWHAAPGVERVRVYRIPQLVKDSVLPHQLDTYAFEPDDPHLAGVVDYDADTKTDYVYRLVAEVGGRTSPAVDVSAASTTPATPIDDLRATVDRQPTDDQFGFVTLEWPAPARGHVVIYRSPSPAPAGFVGKTISESLLTEHGLTEQVPNPESSSDQPGMVRMRKVVWPPGWTNAYFIPVTVANGQMIGGVQARVTAVPIPTDPTLQHRGYLQVVSFGWPEGAGSVRAYVANREASPQDVVAGSPLKELDRERYKQEGGLRLAESPGNASNVILTAVVAGQSVSAPVVIPLDPRLVIRYSMSAKTKMLGGVRYGEFTVWSDRNPKQRPPFVVVHNSDHLPLHAGDGETLAIVPDDSPDAQPRRAIQPASLAGGPEGAAFRALAPQKSRGYVRLFVAPQVPEDVRLRIVVLDPPVTNLKWS